MRRPVQDAPIAHVVVRQGTILEIAPTAATAQNVAVMDTLVPVAQGSN